MRNRMRTPLPFIALSALVLVGCTMAPLISSPTPLPPSESTSASPTPTGVDSIGGEAWTLRDVKAGPLDAAAVRSTIGATSITLAGTDEVTGTAGCRTFEAEYELENAMELRVTDLRVDESGCPAPTPGLAEFETFVTGEPVRAEFAGGLLTLSTRGGAYAFAFEAQDDE
jgi:hypothetical protein